jgi:hypothetical protein
MQATEQLAMSLTYSETVLKNFENSKKILLLTWEISEKGRTEKFCRLNFFVNLLHMYAEFVQFAAVVTHSYLCLTI